MKGAIRNLLAAVGLAPASHVARLTADLERANTKLARLEDQLAGVRNEIDTWKHRHEDTAEAVAGWKRAAGRAEGEAERVKASADRIKADLERTKADVEREHARAADARRKADAFSAELQEMRGRLEDAQRATYAANEQLMAMEVKLDLIEAAIHVLDGRTREQAVSHS